jgi:Skp family chaperone for outer membrane proteins
MLAMAAAALLLLTAAPAAAQSTLKIGIFDSQRVSEESEEGKRIQAELEALSAEKQAELAAMEQEFNDLQQRLNQQRLSLSLERRAALELEIQQKGLAYSAAQDLAGRELQLRISAAEAAYNEKMRQVLGRFGLDEGFQLILDASMVAFYANAIDVTTALTDLMNKMYPAAPTGE